MSNFLFFQHGRKQVSERDGMSTICEKYKKMIEEKKIS